MEPFVDFGLFELMTASGVMWLGKVIFRHRISRWAALALSITAPAVLLILASSEATRWIACIALATSVINVSVIVRLLRYGVLDPPSLGAGSQAGAPVRNVYS